MVAKSKFSDSLVSVSDSYLYIPVCYSYVSLPFESGTKEQISPPGTPPLS